MQSEVKKVQDDVFRNVDYFEVEDKSEMHLSDRMFLSL